MTNCTPQRIQRQRTKGWTMPARSIYVGRPGRFGNPFRVGLYGSPAECVALHRGWLDGSLSDDEIGRRFPQPFADWIVNMRHPRLGKIIRELPGLTLACWCPLDQPCHADVLLELANGCGDGEHVKETPK